MYLPRHVIFDFIIQKKGMVKILGDKYPKFKKKLAGPIWEKI